MNNLPEISTFDWHTAVYLSCLWVSMCAGAFFYTKVRQSYIVTREKAAQKKLS